MHKVMEHNASETELEVRAVAQLESGLEIRNSTYIYIDGNA